MEYTIFAETRCKHYKIVLDVINNKPNGLIYYSLYLLTSVSVSARLTTKRNNGVDDVLLCSNKAAWLA